MRELLIIFICSIVYQNALGQWIESNYTGGSSPNPVSELEFPEPNTAYGVAGGEIIKSTDGGINWAVLYDEGPFSNMSNLSFVNANVGFVKSWNSNLRTTDGGATWSPMNWLYDIEIVGNDLYTSYVSNDTSYISTSNDHGDSWIVLFQNYQLGAQQYYISFLDAQNAFFMNSLALDRMYSTNDGFVTIDTAFSTFGDMTPQKHMHFIDSLNGYFYGNWGAQSHPTRTWFGEVIYFPMDLDGFGVLPVLDMAFGTDIIYAGSIYGKIFYTLNNGQYWFEQTTPTTDPFGSIAFADESHGIAGTGNKIYYTSNGGLVGLNEVEPVHFELYPNPMSEEFAIKGNTELIEEVLIYNIAGNEVARFTSTFDKINISDLTNGAYSVVIVSATERTTKKIIKNN
ncbi:MAG: T9SS type A sorting domain-containing protein [Crocinitomicaceae bacterium]|nr:T9SS type A sorting domain-containing protein [Crocinitomicaceae bacterium]